VQLCENNTKLEELSIAGSKIGNEGASQLSNVVKNSEAFCLNIIDYYA